jgi:DNA-binding ferritin-like protein (Dps family)
MMLILTKAGVTSHREFFDDVSSIGAAMEAAGVDDDSVFELLGCDIAKLGLNALRLVEQFGNRWLPGPNS